MSELDVRADGEHRYAATTTSPDGTGNLEHTVLSDPALLAELGLGRVEEPLLVRRALEQLVRTTQRHGDGAGSALPPVIDLAQLHAEDPDLLRNLTLRTVR